MIYRLVWIFCIACCIAIIGQISSNRPREIHKAIQFPNEWRCSPFISSHRQIENSSTIVHWFFPPSNRSISTIIGQFFCARARARFQNSFIYKIIVKFNYKMLFGRNVWCCCCHCRLVDGDTFYSASSVEHQPE